VSGIYYVDAAEWLRAVGITVVEWSPYGMPGDSWTRRARSSGGFAAPPLGIQWHHTASDTTPENDITWQTEGCDDAPVGNATIMRDGSVWMVAAGAANTAGKGGPLTLSRGTVPADGANSRTWAWEVANDGVGERWPAAQMATYFAATLELNRRFGNAPDDVFTHAIGAPECRGWTDRKIDPARADAIDPAFGWRPSSVSSSGTWSLADIRAELRRRAGAGPTPIPPTPGGDVIPQVIKGDGPSPGPGDSYYAWDGVTCNGIPSLEWVQWGYEAGLYQNVDPVLYPQHFVDELVAAQRTT
jgi:hypothetical protein